MSSSPTIKVRVGDWVVAVGNPFGLGGTVTAGIVSARGRDIGAGPYDDFLQIDAAVNRGNSGGPTFNLNGEVIGINTAIFSPSGGSVGIAFDIPASTAKQVIAGPDEERQRASAAGLACRSSRSRRTSPTLGLKSDKGALVSSAQDGGPGKKAGIKAGDVITQVDGKDVASPKELARLDRRLLAGQVSRCHGLARRQEPDGQGRPRHVAHERQAGFGRPAAAARRSGKTRHAWPISV